IDECSPNPCLNGAYCRELVNDFECNCTDGYIGKTCGTDVDLCTPNPCHNGGKCKDNGNSFSCDCPGGFTGDTCGTNIDEYDSDPCLNEGTCTDHVNSFTSIKTPVKAELLLPVEQYIISIATKKSGDIRVCIDPRSVNKVLRCEYYQFTRLNDILSELSKVRNHILDAILQISMSPLTI
ncbi:hypothetical protein LSH36_2109g00005, partial [Paralvinella palmiformis]